MRLLAAAAQSASPCCPPTLRLSSPQQRIRIMNAQRCTRSIRMRPPPHRTAARCPLRSTRRRFKNPPRKKGRRVKYADPWRVDRGDFFFFVFLFFMASAHSLRPSVRVRMHRAAAATAAARGAMLLPLEHSYPPVTANNNNGTLSALCAAEPPTRSTRTDRCAEPNPIRSRAD